MKWLDVAAPPLLARGEQAARSMATRIATGWLDPHALQAPARDIVASNLARPGRVESGGPWNDEDAHARLAAALGEPLGSALRRRFEWYLCRGAFFHNDAHYPHVLFGIWTIDGPTVDVVFPRAGLRVATAPGSFMVFDPFEIHGVLHPGQSEWRAEYYLHAGVSVFLGFEIELNAAVAARFGVGAEMPARVLSSQTRIDAATGHFA